MLSINSINSAISFQGNQSNKQGKLKAVVKKLFERPSQEEIKKRKAENKVRAKACLGELEGIAMWLPFNLLPMYILSKYNGALSADEINTLENAADNFVKNSKLKDVVKINRLETTKPSLKELIQSFVNPFGIIDQIKYGLNAAFNSDTAEIIVPKGKFSLTSFHEMGHALNYNFSKIGKSLQNMRLPLLIGVFAAADVALTAAVLKPDKKSKAKINDNEVDGKEQKESFKNKCIKFMKKVSPLLPATLMTPIVIEEGLASFKGNKIAREVLKEMPKLAKKVKINNAIALLSYISSGVGMSVASFLAIKAADKERARQSKEQA